MISDIRNAAAVDASVGTTFPDPQPCQCYCTCYCSLDDLIYIRIDERMWNNTWVLVGP